MNDNIANHECFKILFEKVLGASRTIYTPITYTPDGQLHADYWGIRVFSKSRGQKTSTIMISYCPFCGGYLGPEKDQPFVEKYKYLRPEKSETL